MSISLKTVGEGRSARYLSLGAALLGSSGAALLTGCGDDAPPPSNDWNVGATEQAAQMQGVTVVIRETADGFVIDDEQITDGASKTVIFYLDGRTETLTDPEQFASKLPAQPPQQVRQSGFGLGDVLMLSLLMNVWRPAAYGGFSAAAPPRAAYSNNQTFANRAQTRSTLSGLQSRGLAPASASQATQMRARATAPATRSTSPGQSGRSGYGNSSGRASRGG